MRKIWLLAPALLLCLGANGGGCSNPNAVGVEQFGTVVGRVLDATTNQPVQNALVSVGSIYTAYSDPTGAFSIPHIPIGVQHLTASAAGYYPQTVRVRIKLDQNVSAGYVRIMPVTGGPTAPPPPTPSPTPGIATPIPALSPAPSPSASASATASATP